MRGGDDCHLLGLCADPTALPGIGADPRSIATGPPIRGGRRSWTVRRRIAASWRDGVRSMAVGLAGNRSLATGAAVDVADLDLGAATSALETAP